MLVAGGAVLVAADPLPEVPLPEVPVEDEPDELVDVPGAPDVLLLVDPPVPLLVDAVPAELLEAELADPFATVTTTADESTVSLPVSCAQSWSVWVPSGSVVVSREYA